MKIDSKKNIALVLSGGGIKAAAFHIGVCLALQEKGFAFSGGVFSDEVSATAPNKRTIKIYVGSSAGAIITSLLAAGHSIEDLIDAFRMGNRLRGYRDRTPRPGGLKPLNYWDIFSINGANLFRLLPNFLLSRSLVSGGIEALLKNGFKVNGLFTAKGIERYLRTQVLPTNQFRELRSQLYIVGTQLNHSRKAVFGPFETSSKIRDIHQINYATISQAVAASASLPPVFAPYGIKNEKGKEIHYFDGEIRDTLSTHVAADNGADLVIASYSVQPYHFNKEMGSLHNYGIPLILNQALYQVIEQKIQRAIQYRADIHSLLNTVDGYFKQAGLPEEHRTKLLDAMAKKVSFNPAVDYMYIHPHAQDYEMFFVDHFSLNQEILGRIVRIGFKSALRVLRQHNL